MAEGGTVMLCGNGIGKEYEITGARRTYQLGEQKVFLQHVEYGHTALEHPEGVVNRTKETIHNEQRSLNGNVCIQSS